MKGRRVMPNDKGGLPELQPGDYGRATWADAKYPGNPVTWWVVMAPNGDSCSLNPAIHTVVEHEDGTITVSPSIQILTGYHWHGYLHAGKWIGDTSGA